MKAITLLTALAAAAAVASGTVLLFAAVALAYQRGLIADAMGGDGATTPVEVVMWILCPVFWMIGAGCVIIAIRSSAPVQSTTAR